MFKNKKTYIIGIIIFTIILIADVAIYFMVPFGANGGGRPSFDAGSFDGEMPEGFEGFEDGEMPEDFDASQMPGSFGGGEMPEGFEGFEGGERPTGGQRGGGFMMAIRSAFWVILIICLLGDAGCIFMLCKLSKKKQSSEPDVKKQKEEPEQTDDDSRPRRDKGNTQLAVIAVILVASVIISNLSGGRNTSVREAEMAVLNETVAINDITSVFSGSGTLQSGEAEAIEIPEGVRVTSYKVGNGEVIKEGDVIAKVNKDSVMNAIYEIQALIQEMDAEIAEVQEETVDSTITARAGGRVKAVYAKTGSSVANVMYQNSALIVISLGGSMTVEITSDREVAIGQEVNIKLSNGTKVEGKVQQTQNKKVIITTSDNGPTLGDSVSVEAKDGTSLGTGTLEASSALKVTGYTGTVEKIHVSVGDVVAAGDTLLTLEDAKDQSRYQELLREREELIEMEGRLAGWYQEGAILAEKDGVISQLDDTSDIEVSEMSYVETKTDSYVRLTTQTESIGSREVQTQGQTVTYAGKVTKVSYNMLEFSLTENDVTGTEISKLAEMDEGLFKVKRQYSPAADVTVKLYEDETLKDSTINALQQGDKVLITLEGEEIKKIEFIAGKAETQEPSQGTTPGNTPSQGTTSGNTPSQGAISGSAPSQGTMQGGIPSQGSMSGDMTQSMIPNGMMQEDEEEEAEYVIETETLCAIIPTETMSVQVSVDELDILSLEVGQTAMVTLDAVPGQEFEGSVKKISSLGSNDDGGSTKYTVTMEIPRTEEMLSGMNASIKIEVGRKEGVLTIPAAAVYEDGNRTYVYTAVDKDTKEPINAVDVTTGASDGTNIEILSGELSEGDAVCYQYADSIVYRIGN